MNPEPVPSAIVSRLVQTAKELEEWADTHRTANLAEHEQGVLEIFRRNMRPALGALHQGGEPLEKNAAQPRRNLISDNQLRVGSVRVTHSQTWTERPSLDDAPRQKLRPRPGRSAPTHCAGSQSRTLRAKNGNVYVDGCAVPLRQAFKLGCDAQNGLGWLRVRGV